MIFFMAMSMVFLVLDYHILLLILQVKDERR